jgi:hypothetical protein
MFVMKYRNSSENRFLIADGMNALESKQNEEEFHLSLCLSVCLSLCLSIYLSIYLSTYESTVLLDFGLFFGFLIYT